MDIITDRRSLLGGFALTTVTAGLLGAEPAAAAKPKSHSVTFCMIGDWGRGTPAQHDVAAAMGMAAARSNASSVLAVGDNFYDVGVTSVDDPLWQSMYEHVYTHPALQVPWHAMLGNHDYTSNPQAQVEYTARSPRWRMPARYYKVEDANMAAASVDIFVVDTVPFVKSYSKDPTNPRARNIVGQDTDAQLAWLDGALAASTARWKLVAGHHTIHSGGSAHGDTVELVERLKPILVRNKVQAYLAGHDHDLQHIRRDGLDIVQCGAGMEARPVKPIDGTLYCLAEPGFGLVTVGGDTMTIDFRDQKGAPLYKGSIPVAATVA
ncbi:purple acid phosphatase family protein [Sphingomonas nostoxanthinifaciens]|uniref:purple acid phosphatase family protein n=1 Tax=Sphingomonas nostoxanthinifaciens TaxID=2872652 RepID=UPI001CC1F0F1|nr:tartrate-resistant acid phosphatase type 5 family protein [Sphingomonas nostoxanthinifaciens]UAK23932.1 metallophosphoesterase [Sphingomonas nostoxanthinifaciens]